MKRTIRSFFAFAATLLLASTGIFNACTKPIEEQLDAYLFVYFTGNGPGEEAIRYAVSTDGYNFRALNANQPVLDSKTISTSGGVRDPHILRGADNKTFYMVATDLYVPEQGWNNYAMILMKSTDLVNWQSSVVNIPETFPDEFAAVDRVWAPQSIYDQATGKYLIYFSMRSGDGTPDIIYYAYANKDFTALDGAPKQLYFPPADSGTKACIDGDIIPFKGKFYLFHKAEDGDPGIKLAISDKLTEGYQLVSDKRVDCEKDRVEGSGIFKLNHSNDYILMYDVYTAGRYQFTKSSDLEQFEVIDHEVSMNFHPRHGTVLPITGNELKRLMETYASLDDLMVEATSTELKKLNIDINGATKTIHLPVKRGVNLSSFDPQFVCFDYFSVSPAGPQDFSKGPVAYTFMLQGKGEAVYQVSASEDHNPVLEGYYADPEILFSEKTGKYYIYPTSDGFWNWSGTYFKAFSSDNLVDWTDEGVILDLNKDLSWANRNAWAPCMVEKKINGEYKYFYYFCAAQKIGVAVADKPTGPFTDSGKPLIDFKTLGVNRGQEIDPDVFTDPATGKSYLYWGNGYLAGAELNPDMTTLNLKTLKQFNIDDTYREGAYIIFRNGTYYFMWSEDDTRSPNYKVRYATSDSPMGKLSFPENNIVIRRDTVTGIVATGHNSAIQVPGTDQWYLVYHRFTYPRGLAMGRAGGFHREVCIDKLEFGPNNEIIEVKPSFGGIEPLK